MSYQPVNKDFKEKFNHSLSIGKKGEAIFQKFIETKFPNHILEDVSENSEYQWQEIDYILRYPDGRVVGIELKTDTWSSMPNLAIETMANKEKNRLGWLHTSKATILAYFYINGLDNGEPNLMFYSMEHLREIVTVHGNSFRTYSPPPEPQVRISGQKTTIGLRVPRHMVKPLKAYHIPVTEHIKNAHSVRKQ